MFMNYVFISPNFPRGYSNFAVRLKAEGVNVLGLGQDKYDELNSDLKKTLTEYYRVENMENYDEMLKAIGYFTHKYGKIDRIESHNEHWLMQDARLRTDFNVHGLKSCDMDKMKYKSKMKEVFRSCGIPVARGAVVKDEEEAMVLVSEYGYPVVVKPDMGVGAQDTMLLVSDRDVADFFSTRSGKEYILEEYIEGDIHSYDGLVDQDGDVVFSSSFIFSNGIMDVVNSDLDIFYYSQKSIPDDLEEMGRKAVAAFGLKERFFHIEFFRTKLGELVALEVNIRPPGGYSVDIWNFANDVDMYRQYAQVVARNTYDASLLGKYYCVYTGRKLSANYRNSVDEVVYRYNTGILYHGEIPKILSKALGDYAFIFRVEEFEDLRERVKFILEKK
jgi:predicted ATP-grasp superfamily ATP-dependent carboligase